MLIKNNFFLNESDNILIKVKILNIKDIDLLTKDLDKVWNFKIINHKLMLFFLKVKNNLDKINSMILKIQKSFINFSKIYLFKFYNWNVKIIIIFNRNKKIKSYKNLNDFLINKDNIKEFIINSFNQLYNLDKNYCIKILNFCDLKIKLNNLLNLFVLFGNLYKIYYNFLNDELYLNYETEKSINRLLNNKSKLIIRNKLLIIDIIDNNSRSYWKEIDINKNINLYNKKICKIRYNQPSNIIIITNLTLDISYYKFYLMVLQYGNPIKLKFKSNFKNINKICIIKFANIQESINVILMMNNFRLGNKYLKISFSFHQFN